MKSKLTLLIGLALPAFLAACNGNKAVEAAVPVEESIEMDVNQSEQESSQTAAGLDVLIDEQGAVSVAVTLINLAEADPETLIFEVAMNTHSVDLSMDLAALATLTTDNGHEVSATLWDAQPGGHHVSGRLSFPTIAGETSLLPGARQLTLTIRDVDAPERVFTWQLRGQVNPGRCLLEKRCSEPGFTRAKARYALF